MIYICEGFDMVGKDTFISRYLPNIPTYRPSYSVYDKYIFRDKAWIYGFTVIDFMNQLNLLDKSSFNVVLNRWLPSSYVYTELNNPTGNHDVLFNAIMEDYLLTIKDLDLLFDNITIYHISHFEKSTARKIYEISQSRPNNEPLDEFDDFECYYDQYLKAEKLYAKFYNDNPRLKVYPIYNNGSQFYSEFGVGMINDKNRTIL